MPGTEWPQEEATMNADMINIFSFHTENNMCCDQGIFSMKKFRSYEKLIYVTFSNS